jgi:polyferredoxin
MTMKTAVSFAIVVLLVLSLSFVSANMWGGKPEKLPDDLKLNITSEMTVGEFISSNGMEKPFAKNLLGLTSPTDLERKLTDFGSPEDIQRKYKQSASLKAESESKNWVKIPLKFALWFVFLITAFILLKKGKIKASNRKWIYAASFAIFGIILGSDPSPMGTVKDAVYLYGKAGVIFPPRMVALSVFLLTVLFANKFICSWGCQLGTLQDFIFRLGRNKKDTGEGAVAQYKVPFVTTNAIRLLVFGAMFYSAFVYAADIFAGYDPFKIFSPKAVTISGGIFIAFILVLSLFTYRPWCSMFCPFGFVGWIVEKLSTFRIKVKYDTCIACGKCADSCPSTVMEAILKQDKLTIPDCFSCGTCIEVCPTKSVEFAPGKRDSVPEKKFER